MPRVLFYVQHLLGIGHVVRAARIANALSSNGFEVNVAFGGPAVEGFNWGSAQLHHLPAISSGPAGFATLVNAEGEEINETFKQHRQDDLLALFDRTDPDVLLIEAYPFARRGMRFELRPLLDAAHAKSHRPIIASSIRDILQEGRMPKRIKETTELLHDYFDAVLVHGDERFAPLSMSFPETNLISDMVHYTGIVGPARNAVPPADHADIIVSAGGGAVGADLLHAALNALPATKASTARWLFVTGPNLDAETYDDLQASLPENCSIERFRKDLPDLFHHAKLSISQAGYNTVADILAGGCRCVLVPFSRGGETEQTRRAELLERSGRAVMVSENKLTPEAMARAIDKALGQDLPETHIGEANGARQTAKILKKLLAEKET